MTLSRLGTGKSCLNSIRPTGVTIRGFLLDSDVDVDRPGVCTSVRLRPNGYVRVCVFQHHLRQDIKSDKLHELTEIICELRIDNENDSRINERYSKIENMIKRERQ